jgi:Ca2+-binding RTX toxin-like protein
LVVLAATVGLAALIGAAPGRAAAAMTERVSVTNSGRQANDRSASRELGGGSVVSADGRFVAFDSLASNLVPGDTNGVQDVFVRDRTNRRTVRVSVSSGGVQANGYSYVGSISANGRYVVFSSSASNLISMDTNDEFDVFVRDRSTDRTMRVSVGSTGTQGNGYSDGGQITPDGRYITFRSESSNLVRSDTNDAFDSFVRDRVARRTMRVSVSSSGQQGDGYSEPSGITADGRFVVFVSQSTNLVPGDTNGYDDVFLRDRWQQRTVRVSVATGGGQAVGGGSTGATDAISVDGRYVAFMSEAPNLVIDGASGARHAFVRDRKTGQTTQVDVSSANQGANGWTDTASLSRDGRYIAFSSAASNLVAGDTNDASDIFLRDRQLGTTTRVSVGDSGQQANDDTNWEESVSADGRHVVFSSGASNLVSGDTNGATDVFVRDLTAPLPPPVACDDVPATIIGTSAGEVIHGTPGPDVIWAGGGADTVYAGGGDDIVCGNRGADRLYGGAGNDRLIGGFGADHAHGDAGNDTLNGGTQDDALDGGLGWDVCNGDLGIDRGVACEVKRFIP